MENNAFLGAAQFQGLSSSGAGGQAFSGGANAKAELLSWRGHFDGCPRLFQSGSRFPAGPGRVPVVGGSRGSPLRHTQLLAFLA